MNRDRWERMERMRLTLACGDVVEHGPRADDDPVSYRGFPLSGICEVHGPQEVVEIHWLDGAEVLAEDDLQPAGQGGEP